MTREERNAYARARTAKKRQARECFKCASPVARGRSKTRCAGCLDRSNAKSAERHAKGLCVQCGKRKDGKHGILCRSCREQYRKLKQALRQRRHAEGLCTNCGKLKGINTYLRNCFACRTKAHVKAVSQTGK